MYKVFCRICWNITFVLYLDSTYYTSERFGEGTGPISALGQNQGYMGDAHILLITMDVPIIMMWESNVNQVSNCLCSL